MEGAFDGQTDLLKKLLEEGKIFYDFCDKSGNTPISEAAAGGQCDCIRLLYDYGADINRQCQFKRTPLYRAIFGGHIDAVRLILDLGGDPRIPDEEGQACLKMPCLPEIGKIVQEWDLSKTDALLQKLEGVKQLKQKELIEKRATQMSQLNQALEDAQKAHAMAQQELSYVYCQLNIRINEHDLLMSEGKDLSIIKTAIHEYEDKLDHARAAAKKAGDALSACKEKIELQQQTDAEQTGAPPGQAAPEKGIKCNIKQLEGLLLKPDPRGEVLKSNGQWPLVVDPSGRSAVFLRYADSNILQVLNPQHMDAEKIRIAVIGSIRYGKPLVIDICEVDVSKSIPEYFNRVEKDLYASIVSRSILQNEKYLSLCRKGDGDQYKRECFHQRYVENFKFIILTTNRFPSEDLVQAFFPVRVVC
ncbi:tankyrase [Polychytrium aggregatum]|uniref:tankyrase n=1 Tax=Polychytrium aggregatum TaxID=110093 RepID=UPI0022FE4401|nr:tankyrase [Polychytrium aggregatum]KAI9205924.1 tankyrase [Polychytrium aggregatum]